LKISKRFSEPKSSLHSSRSPILRKRRYIVEADGIFIARA
jgi:hypothetical protein